MKYLYPILLGIVIFFIGVYFSDFFDLYNRFDHIDKVFHFMGGVALGWFFCVFFSIKDLPMTTSKRLLIVVASTCLIAVFWEYAERLSTLYAPRWIVHWYSGGDLNDTLTDILAGMLGGGTFYVFANIFDKLKTPQS
jgi:hypothetical protein